MKAFFVIIVLDNELLQDYHIKNKRGKRRCSIINILLQIGIVALLVTISNIVSQHIAFPVPVSIIGILILLGLLLTKVLKLTHIEEVSDFFLKNMGFFFIAAGVSILGKYQEIESILLKFTVIVFVTTLITFAITGISVKMAIRLQNKWKGNVKNGEDI